MSERPILRLPKPQPTVRKKRGAGFSPPRPSKTPSRSRQGVRLATRFDPLIKAFEGDNPTIVLREDPQGIAPERALVFETAAPIQNFAKVAREAGLEVLGELVSDHPAEYEDDDFSPPEGEDAIYPTLYATMPGEASFRRLLQHWRSYQKGDPPKEGLTPWWRMFEMLIDLRTWGPDDRFAEDVRKVVSNRLPDDLDAEVLLELEVWPSAKDPQRATWRTATSSKIKELGGRIVHQCSIVGDGFIYEALLVELTVGVVRNLIDNPHAIGGLATLEGLQFILPQTIAQATPVEDDTKAGALEQLEHQFDIEAPFRAVLLDGVPTAAHPALENGVSIEDVHDIVALSPVNSRRHATAMASLILRGDLNSDGTPVRDSRLLCVPILIDDDSGGTSPRDKLFVDVLHTALARCFLGDEPAAPDAFVVNLSIGIRERRFAGRISALARLLDWWSWKYGVLFVVSAGNIPEDLLIKDVTSTEFEDADHVDRQGLVRKALSASAYERSILSPAESLNAITVGAASADLSPGEAPPAASLVRFEAEGEHLPQVTSAVGLGPSKALKPDVLSYGGAQELRISPAAAHTRLKASNAQRTGLVVASPTNATFGGTGRSRGTSPATALTTRALLQAAAALVEDGGPLQGLELPRRDLALATRALAVNAALWPETTQIFMTEAKDRLGAKKVSTGVKDQVARHFGFGLLDPIRMIDCPANGATLIGIHTIKKDQGLVFELFLPPSLSGQKLPRSLRVTLAWFSPTAPTRAVYRRAALNAISADVKNDTDDKSWGVNLKGVGPDSHMAGRGTVWSRRMTTQQQHAPDYADGATVPIRVQCREASAGALTPEDDIPFAIAISFEIEDEVEFDVREEIREKVLLRIQQSG